MDCGCCDRKDYKIDLNDICMETAAVQLHSDLLLWACERNRLLSLRSYRLLSYEYIYGHLKGKYGYGWGLGVFGSARTAMYLLFFCLLILRCMHSSQSL